MNVPMPSLARADTQGALAEMRSYLWQLAEMLNCELENITVREADVRRAIAEKTESENPRAVFNAIKALIIGSADIVEQYYETISARLEGQYVAQSEFGEFRQTTSAAIEANAAGITQLYENLQSVTSALEDIGDMLIAVTATIRTGYLYTDEQGVDWYGLEIGQKNEVDGVETFNRFARFTAERLSFFDNNDTEIAWISGYTMHITSAEIGRLAVGQYSVEPEPGGGLAFFWKGA